MTNEDYYEAAKTVLEDIVQCWVIDESDWFYEDVDLVEDGYDIDTLRAIILDMVRNIA